MIQYLALTLNNAKMPFLWLISSQNCPSLHISEEGKPFGLAQLDTYKFVCYSINKNNDNPLWSALDMTERIKSTELYWIAVFHKFQIPHKTQFKIQQVFYSNFCVEIRH